MSISASRRQFLTITLSLMAILAFSQKKPLDHTVYDGWETIQERVISDDGKWLAFSVVPQEGDAKLVVKRTDGSAALEIPRAYGATISSDSRYCIFRIRPFFKDTREARIRKKKPDEMPKDSLGIVALGSNEIKKIAKLKSFKTTVEGAALLAYLVEKPLPDSAAKKRTVPGNARLDSAFRVIDSLRALIETVPRKTNQKVAGEEKKIKDFAYDLEAFGNADADAETVTPGAPDEGGLLTIYNFASGKTITLERVADYGFSKNGTALWIRLSKGKDSLAKPSIVWYDPATAKQQVIMEGFNDVKNIAIDEAGTQLAFAAERDSSAKSLKKFYKIWYYKQGQDTAKIVADKMSKGKTDSLGISPDGRIFFSKTGQRLFFGVAPMLPPKDTTVPDFEKATLDVWNYQDELLQTVQLKNLDRDLKKSYTCSYDMAANTLVQLSDKYMDTVGISNEGDGKLFIGVNDHAYRLASQWLGRGKKDVYAVDPNTGAATLAKAALDGNASVSAGGNYIYWYDVKSRNYFTWKNGSSRNISSGIKTALYDEENDMPDDPAPYGIMGWGANDEFLYVYDHYDIWKLDADGSLPPVCVTKGAGRKYKLRFRYERLKRDERVIPEADKVLLSVFDEEHKTAALVYQQLNDVSGAFTALQKALPTFPLSISNIRKAEQAAVLSFSTETYQQSPDIEVRDLSINADISFAAGTKLFQPNLQQQNFNWGTAELLSWKAYDGKATKGILYKPEDFDPARKYPLLIYFYETLSDGLYSYLPPSPTPSRLNIPFFVSRGYCVLAPDIHYKTGQPGQDAYNYIVSGARYVVSRGFVDSTKMGLQGQSWGGYQTAILITMTNLFKAAWAGAPVVNMTSAYGGIRWESGVNRQFQYEKTQTRIGASLFERPDLYIKNSPLFHLQKVKTPLVIMSNDADGAVPWYQGIEFFTAMRRLGKPVWLLSYNGEAHNLVERRNRKDIQVREQQFFDWQLKGDPAPRWITTGVPAVEKGRNWGL